MDVNSIRRTCLHEIQTATDRMRVCERLESITLPSETRMSAYGISVYGDEIHLDFEVSYYLHRPQDVSDWHADSLPWDIRIKPIGEILRAFHSHTIKRSVDDYGGVSYTAKGTLHSAPDEWPEKDHSIVLTVRVREGGISPTCEILKETVTEVVTHTKVKVVCA